MSAEDFLWQCPYKKYFGIKCFGCGAQTALLQLLRGNFAEAFKTYPAIYLIVFSAIFIAFISISKKKKYQRMIFPLIILNLIAIILQYYLL